jgi:hypothetical protein
LVNGLAEMFANQTSIGRIVAHCAMPAEPLQTRLRISHLLQSADFTPPGFPPQAILIVRKARSLESISLSSFRLRSQWETHVREMIAGLYRTAVRPLRGIVPAGAPAVLFADTGEWLACMGRAVHARGIEQSWYWRASLGAHAASSALSLAREWANTPRFVPAAIAHLAEWGRVFEVLQLFSPAEANAIFAALAGEWDLPKREWEFQQRLSEFKDEGSAQIVPRSAPAAEHNSSSPARTSNGFQPPPERARRAEAGERKQASALPEINLEQRSERSLKPPSQTWWPALEESCEDLPRESQRLLAGSVALFHAPARARSASFATEVQRWLFAISERHEPAAAPQIKVERSAAPEVPRTPKAATLSENVLSTASPTLKAAEVWQAPASGPPGVDSKAAENVSGIAEKPAAMTSDEARSRGASEIQNRPFWLNLSGCETKIGGVLFLINLIQQTGLPDCFDEEFSLSQHIGGWGLVELLGKALLGPMGEDFHDDPLWAMLQRLDGRTQGELPGASLPPINEYRMPVEWLQRFVPLDQPWVIHSSLDRFRLLHRSGAFVVVDCVRGPLSSARQAATELARYRAQGIIAMLDESEAAFQDSGSAFFLSLQGIPEWKNLPAPMRRWLRWTFPFFHYLLVRAIGAEAGTPLELTRLLLLKTGTLYCTATHIDLVMRMDQIALPVRRAGLDANPGWLLDLRRAVSFHYQ